MPLEPTDGRPMRPITIRFNAQGELMKKPRLQEWGWFRCTACGEAMAKPLTRTGTLLSTHKRCVFCGGKR